MAVIGASGRPPATPGLPRRPSRLTNEALLERLRLLAPLAAANRGPVPLGDRRRVGAVEFTWLLAEARRRGISTRDLAAATGVRWATLDQRLRRHAMTATVPPSMSTYQGRQVQRPNAVLCKRQHEFSPENTYVFTDAGGRSHRSCRRCRADREAKRRAEGKVALTESGEANRVPAAGSREDDRRRRDQQTRSDLSLRTPASADRTQRIEAKTLTISEVADLQERLTGVRPAPATLRSYLSRGQMPAQVQPGLWNEPDIRRWLRRGRMRRTPTRLAPVRDRLADAVAAGDHVAVGRAVRSARNAGAGWDLIAQVLGVSRQAAWKRYRTMAAT